MVGWVFIYIVVLLILYFIFLCYFEVFIWVIVVCLLKIYYSIVNIIRLKIWFNNILLNIKVDVIGEI